MNKQATNIEEDTCSICESGANAQASVDRFLREHGVLGSIVLSAWNGVDPLHCYSMPDEYLGYAERFVKLAVSTIDCWDCCPDMVEELVRRSHYPSQVCFDKNLDGYWVTPEDVKKIAKSILDGANAGGGMEELCDQQ